jgi:hypothetical protein
MKKLTEIHPGNYVFYDLQQNMVSYVFEDFILKSKASSNRRLAKVSHLKQPAV